MKRLRRLVAIGLTLAVAAGCRAPAQEAHTPSTADSTLESAHGATPAPEAELPMGLSLQDDGRAVELAPGQVVLVSLAANHTTGYRWVLADSLGPVLVREGEPAYDADSTAAGVGVGGFETWRFRATAAGADTIVLEHRRPWEAGKPAETTVRYFVRVR